MRGLLRERRWVRARAYDSRSSGATLAGDLTKPSIARSALLFALAPLSETRLGHPRDVLRHVTRSRSGGNAAPPRWHARCACRGHASHALRRYTLAHAALRAL